MVAGAEFRVAGGNYELAVPFYHQHTHTVRKILVLELNSAAFLHLPDHLLRNGAFGKISCSFRQIYVKLFLWHRCFIIDFQYFGCQRKGTALDNQ